MSKTTFVHTSLLAKHEPLWRSVDRCQLPEVAFAKTGDTRDQMTHQHHWVKGGSDTNGDGVFDKGTLYLHKVGLCGAWAAANGSAFSSPIDFLVLAHLRKHFAELGLKKAVWAGSTYDVTEFDQNLITAGYLTLLDLQVNLAAMTARIMGGEE